MELENQEFEVSNVLAVSGETSPTMDNLHNGLKVRTRQEKLLLQLKRAS